MKRLNNTMIIVVAIISTILSYPSWLPVVLIGNMFRTPGPAIDYTIFIVFSLALFFWCRRLYRLYTHTEKERTAWWRQIGFIFLVSFTIKFIFDHLFLLPGNILSYFIMYGMDIIIIAPIAVVVNLIIANRKRRKTTTKN